MRGGDTAGLAVWAGIAMCSVGRRVGCSWNVNIYVTDAQVDKLPILSEPFKSFKRTARSWLSLIELVR